MSQAPPPPSDQGQILEPGPAPNGEARAPRRSDAANWARSVSTLSARNVPSGAINLNVEGRRVTSPVQGFGKMWQKTYRIHLAGTSVTPQDVIREWKQNFQSFWPARNFFYGPLTGITPGDVAVLNLALPGRMKLSTGVLVMYADDESFTLMTPEGHMFAGWITFSAEEAEGGTLVQAQVLMRASDPLYELGLALGGHRKEDKFWRHTLGAVAAHFGITDQEVVLSHTVVDKKRQWSCAKNIRHNAAIRTGLYMMGAPFRLVAKPFRRKKSAETKPAEDRADVGDA